MEEDEERSLLILSLTINACTLCYFLSGKIVNCALQRWRLCGPVVSGLADLSTRQPWLSGKIWTEQLASLVLVVLSLSALGGTSVGLLPFHGPRQEPDDSLLHQILAIQVGRYLYMSIQGAFLHNQLPNFRVDLIHHLVATSAYVVFLTYRQNLLLCVASCFMEINLLPLEIMRLLRKAGVPQERILYRSLSLGVCVITVVSRGLVPVLVLAVAVSRQSPFTMNYPPLTVFFLCAVFVTAVNVWMIYRTLWRYLRVALCPSSREGEREETGNVWSNLSGAFRDADSRRSSDVKLSGLNYGLLRSYDNRNLCSLATSNEKINITKTKSVSKNLLPGTSQVKIKLTNNLASGPPATSPDSQCTPVTKSPSVFNSTEDSDSVEALSENSISSETAYSESLERRLLSISPEKCIGVNRDDEAVLRRKESNFGPLNLVKLSNITCISQSNSSHYDEGFQGFSGSQTTHLIS